MNISVSRQEMIDWANSSAAFYGLDLTRISTVFLAEVYASEINGIYDTFDITNAIKAAEGLIKSNGTQPEKYFRHPPLIGLHKKHFTSPRFLIKNILNFMRSKEGDRHYNKIWEEACRVSESDIINEKFLNYLSHHVVVDPIEIKSSKNKITGEWIVFKKHSGANYYLTLAFHEESNEEIHKKSLLACQVDNFPFEI